MPYTHLRGSGCPPCGRIKAVESRFRKLFTEDFINEARSIHGKLYDYSNVSYINKSEKVDIICPAHGLFSQRAAYHLNGNGCKQCNCPQKRSHEIHDDSEIMKEIKSFHNDFFEIIGRSFSNEVNSYDYIIFKCLTHGITECVLHDFLLKKSGCSQCKQLS